jgi:branched-chain amino acid transport system substrate-binding protein
MYVYIILKIILLSLILSACTSSPEEIAKQRIELAKTEDVLAECRLLVTGESFKNNLKECHEFIKMDKNCIAFPEQKEGCTQFIHAANYRAKKLSCQKLSYNERTCSELLDSKIPSWLYKSVNSLGFDWQEKSWVDRLMASPIPNIIIGVVRSGYGTGNFINGVNLAISEVNSQGGVLGRKLIIDEHVTSGDLNISREIAEYMRDNKHIRMVVGRQFSSSTIPVSYVYENANIAYLAVSATNKNVIRYGMQFIFRQLPNNNEFSKALVNFCKENKYKKIALLYTRNSYSEELSYAFRDYAINNQMKIVFEKSFFDEKKSFVKIAASIRKLDLDVIFLATNATVGNRVIDDLYSLGITVPFIGSDSLDSTSFVKAVGEKGNGIVIPTVYNLFSNHSENTKFVKAFRNEYGYLPNTWAAQGYDAIKLLAYVMNNEVNSTVSANIVAGLRHMPTQIGATGKYKYKESGEISNKAIYFKELQNEEFILLKNKKQKEQTLQIEIINDRIIQRPEKSGEST